MQQHTVNPDAVCRQAIQAKLNVCRAGEHFECTLKLFNDQLDNLINLVAVMKSRILELERNEGKEVEATAGDNNASGND